MKLMIVTVLLALMLIPNIAIADTVTLIENTDKCTYKPLLDKDYCYSIYEICDDVSYDSKNLNFDFKQEKGISATNKLNYVLKETDTLDPKCKRIKIEGYKNPYINIDNIPCYNGYCYKEYAWWNTSFPHKWEINASINAGEFTMPILINDSYVEINGSKEYVWCNYTVNTTSQVVGYFYFDNFSIYQCVDLAQTNRVEQQIDSGNGSDYLNPFDENLFIGSHLSNAGLSNAEDISIYNNDCTFQNDPARTTGKVSYGTSLDGTDYYECSDIDTYGNNITLMAWVKFDSLPNINMPIIAKWSGDGFQPFMLHVIRSGSPTNPLRASFQGNFGSVVGTTIMTTGDWYHLLGKMNDTHMCLFVNGVAENCNLIISNITYNSISIDIGHDSGGNFVSGTIDEYRLYNRTLSDNEIRALYENQNGTFNIAILGNQSNIFIPPPIPPIPPNITILDNISLTYDISRDLPIKLVYCSGNHKVTLRERTSCIANGCIVSNQTDILICAYGCEDNLTSIGAECVPTTFETLYTGWGLFFIGLVALLFGSFILKKKKRKGKRWL